MPNHCWNTLRVTGKEAELEKFRKFAEGEPYDSGEERVLDFDKFVPYPEKYKALDLKAREDEKNKIEPRVKDGYNSGGYEWCIANWSTKWNAYDVTFNKVLDKKKKVIGLSYNFSTAWAPPEKVVRKMGEMFPELCVELDYEESGEGFSGELVMVNGEVAKDIAYDMNKTYDRTEA